MTVGQKVLTPATSLKVTDDATKSVNTNLNKKNVKINVGAIRPRKKVPGNLSAMLNHVYTRRAVKIITDVNTKYLL
jgi:hypothetical protein